MKEIPNLYKDRRKEGKTSIRQCQLVELHLLHVFDRICKKHNLRYALFWGSLLGAIRHDGFIPWDDDLDVAMPEEDYKKFLEIASRELPDDVTIHDMEKLSHVDSYGGFTKLRDAYSAIVEPHPAIRTEDAMGIFLDIFPLKQYPELPFNGLNRLQYVLCALDRKYFVKLNQCGRHWKYALCGGFTAMFYDFCRKSVRACLKLLNKMYKKSRKRVWYLEFYSAYNRFFFEEEDLFPMNKTHVFEDGEFFVPNNPHNTLTKIYGNYMQLPPEEKRTGSHSIAILPFTPGRKGMKYPEL